VWAIKRDVNDATIILEEKEVTHADEIFRFEVLIRNKKHKTPHIQISNPKLKPPTPNPESQTPNPKPQNLNLKSYI